MSDVGFQARHTALLERVTLLERGLEQICQLACSPGPIREEIVKCAEAAIAGKSYRDLHFYDRARDERAEQSHEEREHGRG